MGTYRRGKSGGKPKLVVPVKEAESVRAVAAANKARDVYKAEIDRLEHFLMSQLADRAIGTETAVEMAIRVMSEDKAASANSAMVPVDTSDIEEPEIATMGEVAPAPESDGESAEEPSDAEEPQKEVVDTEESKPVETSTEEEVDSEVLDEERG